MSKTENIMKKLLPWNQGKSKLQEYNDIQMKLGRHLKPWRVEWKEVKEGRKTNEK